MRIRVENLLFNGIFLLNLCLPALQYLAFLRITPIVNITVVYGISIAVSIILIIIQAIKKRMSANSLRMMSVILICLLTAQQLVWLSSFQSVGESNIFFSNFVLTAVVPLNLFMLGILYHKYPTYNKVLWGSFLLYIIVISYGVLTNYRDLGMTVIKFVDYNDMSKFNYLSLADGFVVCTLFLISRYLNKKYIYFFILLLSLLALTAAFSRTSLIIFSVILGFQIIKDKRNWGIGVAIAFAFLYLSIYFIDLIQASKNYERIISLISDPSSDSSFLGRSGIAQERLKTLGDHIYLGEYMTEWWQTGNKGEYFHNILSYLDSYGIFTFSLLLAAIAMLAERARKLSFLYWSITVFVILAAVFSRSYLWAYIWLALGLCSNSMTPYYQIQKESVKLPPELSTAKEFK